MIKFLLKNVDGKKQAIFKSICCQRTARKQDCFSFKSMEVFVSYQKEQAMFMLQHIVTDYDMVHVQIWRFIPI